MQQMLQDVQYKYRIYNSEIEPEHETDFYCGCPIHQYQQAKWRRLGMQQMWSKAVMYPGESWFTAPRAGDGDKCRRERGKRHRSGLTLQTNLRREALRRLPQQPRPVQREPLPKLQHRVAVRISPAGVEP